jgi:riboflavin synthase
MFTGVVQAIGSIVRRERIGGGERMVIDAGTLDVGDVDVGDSISVEGCCLTVVAMMGQALSFDLSAETLACTAGLARMGPVNLEKSLRLSDRLDGHLVQGHVDGVGRVVAFDALNGDAGRNWRLDIEAPGALARFIAPKGSIAINGVSLTVNGLEDLSAPARPFPARFHVNLIPHTLAVTTLATLKPDALVNLEVDMMARYAARLVQADESDPA